MIYLDSSAILKLLIGENESEALRAWLAQVPEPVVVSSELAKVEVLRACRRMSPITLPRARELLSGIDLVPLTGSVIDSAAEIEGETLRSLDAIHLASALGIRTVLESFVAYDLRLLSAASAAGLPTATPS